MANPSLLILAGDGLGPEVMAEVKKIIGWMGAKRGVHFDVSEDLVGGCAYDAHGVPLTDATMAKAQAADAVLLGAVGALIGVPVAVFLQGEAPPGGLWLGAGLIAVGVALVSFGNHPSLSSHPSEPDAP